MKHLWRFLLLFLTATALAWGGSSTRPAQAQGRTGLVLAHYYAWFDTGSFAAGKTPFTNPNPYFSTDRGTIQRHVDQARGAGIDGFVQAWYGPDSSQQTEPNFAALLDIAGGSGFKAAVNFEPISAFMPNNDVRAAALSTLLATHAQHPAYLRMDGRPVIFFWANWALSVGDWEYIRSVADPNRTSIWMAEGGNMSYMSVFDGMYLYNIAWSPDPAGINLRWGGETRAATSTYGGGYKYWAATAMPGFNDSLLGRGSNTIVRDRGDGAYLRSSFSGAAQSGPDLILINSFNEWPEGSHIEPANEFGDFYLNLTRELIGTFKAGGIPAAAPLPPPPSPTPQPENSPPAEAGRTGGGGTTQQQVPAQATSPPPPPQAAQPTPTPLPDGRIVYLVQPGDTLISIAITFDVTLDELYSLNNLGPNSLLSVGQEITIGLDDDIVSATATAAALTSPPPTSTPNVLEGFPNTAVRESDGAIIYNVREGNTIIEIALIYDVTLEDIYEWNGLNENSLIAVDQPIIVGYVPTPEPENVGGSADLPGEPPTATPSPSPTPPPSATPPPPSATPIPTATADPAPAPSPTPIPLPSGGSGQFSSWFLSVLFIAVGLLALIGALLLYLSRRT